MRLGKPAGLWYAADTVWIDLAKHMKIPAYRYKYEFPLEEDKFVEDMSTPDITKLFRLTAANIGTFQKNFEAYLPDRLKEAIPRRYVIVLNSAYSDLRTDEEKEAKIVGQKYERLLLKHATDFKNGLTTQPNVYRALRLIEYGNFLETIMKPLWGGIHYDESLFTEELKAIYPFIGKVEIPSGCLWHPMKVMPGYVPTPVTGGKRTRRKRLRKSTRRRR